MKRMLLLLAFGSGLCFAGDAGDYVLGMAYLSRNTEAKYPIHYALSYQENNTSIVWNVSGVLKPTFSELDAIMPQALAWYDETEEGSKKRIQAAAESNLVALCQSIGYTNRPINWLELDAIGEAITATNEIAGLKLQLKVMKLYNFYKDNGGDPRKAGKKK